MRVPAVGYGHTFRATGITAFISNGVDLKKARNMAGHAASATTELYDGGDQQSMLNEVERTVTIEGPHV